VLYVLNALHFKEFTAQISLRDPNNKEKYIGSDENWAKAEAAIVEAVGERDIKTVTEYGEAAFYGPKLDFHGSKDAIGRSWQLGTIQVDYNLPERFELGICGQRQRQAPSRDDPSRPIWQYGAVRSRSCWSIARANFPSG
jgi:threonyl-tRNA synthetase